MLTRDALVGGYWFSSSYGREWDKYSVVEPVAKVILITNNTKHSCQSFINYLTASGDIPSFFKVKVDKYYRDLDKNRYNAAYKKRLDHGTKL